MPPALTPTDLAGLAAALAESCDNGDDAIPLLAQVGVAPGQLPGFDSTAPEAWWLFACRVIQALSVNGSRALVAAAADRWPGNRHLHELRARLVPADDTEHAGAPASVSTIGIEFPDGTSDDVKLAILRRAREVLNPSVNVTVRVPASPAAPAEPPPPPPPAPHRADGLIFMHVSDLHFGQARNAAQENNFRIIRLKLLEDARDMRQRLGPPDCVFITGDLAFKADRKDEYPRAEGWISQLMRNVDVGKDRIFVIPGNHDIDRGLARKGFAVQAMNQWLRNTPALIDELLADPQAMMPCWPKLEAFADFAEPYAAPKLTPHSPFWVKTVESGLGPVVVAGLNTALLCQDEHDNPTNLTLGGAQLIKAILEVPQDRLLLVLQHHPPEWLTDGPHQKICLANRPHILFCGHVHAQDAENARLVGHGAQNGVLRMVAGAGNDPDSDHHGYSWGTLSPQGMCYYPRVWSKRNMKFGPDRNDFELDQDEAVCIGPRELPQALAQWLAGCAQ